MTYAAIINKKNSLWTKLQNFSVFAILFVKFLLFTPQKKSGVPPLPCRFQTLLHYATQHHNSVAPRPKGQEESC